MSKPEPVQPVASGAPATPNASTDPAMPNAPDTSAAPTEPGQEYLEIAAQMLNRLRTHEWPKIREAAQLIADALALDHLVHAFGTGHSHMLAEEMFYRAGGLVNVNPILFEGLMLHANAPLSTSLERLPGLAQALIDHHTIEPGDVVIIASNSGSNAVTSEMAGILRHRKIGVIAITSLRHARSPIARANTRPRLHELADVVIDNGGFPGDAAITVEGFGDKVSPTSTVTGAAIINAIVAQTVQVLVNRGVQPDVFRSSNTSGGDVANSRYLSRSPR